jgi:Uma2 family endonuclease
MPVCERTYLQVAAEDPEGKWELHDGALVRRPAMTAEHEDLAAYLGAALIARIPRDRCRVRIAGSRARRSAETWFVPDVMVVPTPLVLDQAGTGKPEVFRDSVTLVVEIWSPSTGPYDRDVKVPAYQQRGDAEIWLIHPYERTLTAWRRQPDGGFQQQTYRGGIVPAASLPGVAIDLDALLD